MSVKCNEIYQVKYDEIIDQVKCDKIIVGRLSSHRWRDYWFLQVKRDEIYQVKCDVIPN